MNNDKLNYLKEEFLKNFKLNLYTCKSNEDIYHFKDFFHQMPEFRQQIIKADSKEELKTIINNISTIFHEKLSKIDPSDVGSTIPAILFQFYLEDSHLNDKKWIESTEQIYEDKIINNMLLKSTNSSSDFKEWLEFVVNMDNKLESNFNIQEQANILVQKYNLAYIDLTKATNEKSALDYLQKLDQCAEQMAKDMNMPNEYLGINGTIGLHYNNDGHAFHNRILHKISLDLNMVEKTHLLHEWVHALDAHIYESHMYESGYTSEHEELIVDKNTSSTTGQAFYLMRQLTQNIFSNNKEELKKIIEQKTQEGLSKFWSVIIGPEWYSMSKEQRQYFFGDEAKTIVENYLSNTNNKYFLQELSEYIKIHGHYDEQQIKEKIKNNAEYLKDNVAPYFKKINENIIGKKSFYFILANLSNWEVKRENIKNKVIEFITGKKPVNSTNLIGGNYGVTYYTQPCEMIARYFESQLYKQKYLLKNILQLYIPYKLTKDKDFEEKKDNILESVFQPEKTLEKIKKLRQKFSAESFDKKKLVTMKIK